MRIERVPIERINPAPYNPRKDLRPGDPEYEALRQSVGRWGLVEPLVWNERTGNLVGGHQRLKVLIEQGVTEVEVSVVDLDPEEEKALNLALNKIQGDWDEAKLAELLEELRQAGDVVRFTGFDEKEIDRLLARVKEKLPQPYTYKVDAVQYEPRGNPGIEELADTERYEALLERIEQAECGEDVKAFLRLAATRFIRFDFAKIADYYANAEPDVQRLFEELALVIIDFEDAIAKGFVRFTKKVAEMFEEEYGSGAGA